MRRYRAFISYSWADKAWGEWLHRALETYRTPSSLVGRQTPLGAAPKSLHPIFKDREEEAAGASIGASIEAAMAESEFLIVLCSPRSAQSKWVNREVAWFKKNRDPNRILALIIDGEPMASALPGREAEECFPKTLAFTVGDDLQPTDEAEDPPLAADARESGDGRRGAKLKLAAALLGVGLDDLVRRDERRRTIRRRLVTSAAFGLAAALGGLAVFAFNQRDAAVLARAEAESQRNAALAAEGRAVKARDDAEGLIELILTDLKSDLEGYGTLKSVTAIGNRAIGYYEGQDVKALSPDQLGRRARVLLMLGEADNKRGNLSAALARYQAAAATTSEQLARDPGNQQRMFDHAQSVFWVGYIAWQRGDRAAARRQFTEYHDLALRLVALDPENEDWQAELEYAYSNLGTLAMDDGEAAAAEGYFRKSLELALARLEKAPEDVDRILAAGQSHAWLADALHWQVKLGDEGKVRSEEIALYERALQSGAENNLIKRALSVASYRFANVRLSGGDVETALVRARSAAELSVALVEEDPTDTNQIDRASVAFSALAEAQYWSEDISGASASITSAADYAQSLLRQDKSVTKWKAHIRPTLLNVELYRKSAQPTDAPVALDQLIADLASELDQKGADLLTTVRFGEALVYRARLSPSDKSAWAAAISALDSVAEHTGPDTQALLAEAYVNSGRNAEAKIICARLFEAGYRHPAFMRLLDEFPALEPAAERRAP